MRPGTAPASYSLRRYRFAMRDRSTAFPYDCLNTCALEVEIIGGKTIGNVCGARENSYRSGVISVRPGYWQSFYSSILVVCAARSHASPNHF